MSLPDPKETPINSVIVETTARGLPAAKAALQDWLLKLAGTVDDLPSDMVRNHDHCIHEPMRKERT
jgi:hypothetical protein